MVIKKYLFLILVFFLFEKSAFVSEHTVNNGNEFSVNSRQIYEVSENNYTLRHLRSDLVYGSCIVTGCAAGAFVTLLPMLRIDVGIMGVDLGLRLFAVEYLKPLIFAGAVGAIGGCCVGSLLKAKIISGYRLWGPSQPAINENNIQDV